MRVRVQDGGMEGYANYCVEPEPNLYALYLGLCASAQRRRTALTLAIEDGATADGDQDEISRVTTCVVAEALKGGGGRSFPSEELRSLVPLDAPDASGFPQVPVDGVPSSHDVNAPAPASVWAFKMGYARDRVAAYARVKAAMLDVHNLSAGPEMQAELFRVWGRAQASLRAAEGTLEQRAAIDSRPLAVANEIHAKRRQWEAVAKDVADAQRQQPTLLGHPAMLGYTSDELERLADDPKLERPETLGGGREKQVATRDDKIDTETFVSIVFPAHDNRHMAAAGAVDGAVMMGTREFVTPGLVTMHNTRGVVQELQGVDGTRRHAFVTEDAAQLLARAHALARNARRPFNRLQRECLLLEHNVA